MSLVRSRGGMLVVLLVVLHARVLQLSRVVLVGLSGSLYRSVRLVGRLSALIADVSPVVKGWARLVMTSILALVKGVRRSR